MKKRFSIALTLLLLLSAAVAESRYSYKVSYLGTNTVSVSCRNGADPTGIKNGDVLIITCGK